MRVLFILENYYPNIGGVETLFKSVSEKLVEQGHQVTIVTNRYDKKLKSIEMINGVSVRRTPLYNRYIFTFFAWIWAIPYARQCDIIHTTSYNAGIPAFIAAKLTRRKLINTFHEVWGALWMKLPYFSKLKLKLHQLFERFLLALPFDHYIAVSEYTRNALISHGITEQKVSRIYNGIDYSDFNPRTDFTRQPPYRFMYFGRLGISKGLDILLEAWQHLDGKYDQKLELIIPKEPQAFHENILRIIKDRKISKSITIRSDLAWEELKQLIKSVNCVIVPSYSEGFGYAAVETIALGTPLISSHQGALEEVVSGKYIAMTELSPDALVEAMIKAQNDEFEMSDIKRFDLSSTVHNYIELYKSLLDSKNSSNG